MKAGSKQAAGQEPNQTSTEELIKQLEHRLDWLTGQPAEEINEEEIENILNLLDHLKPLGGSEEFNPAEAYERFENNYLNQPEKIRQAEEEADRREFMTKLAHELEKGEALPKQPQENTEESKDKTGKKKKVFRHHRRVRILKNVGIAAAIMLLVFAGLNIATYATAKKGLFDFIINRKNTMSNMYIGDGDNVDVMNKNTYYSWDDVPSEIKEGILLPSYLPEGMEIEKINVFGDVPKRIDIRYKNDIKYLRISIRKFENEKVKDEITNPEAEYYESEVIDNIEYYLYKYETQNLIFFVIDAKIYYVYTDLSIDEVKTIVLSIQK